MGKTDFASNGGFALAVLAMVLLAFAACGRGTTGGAPGSGGGAGEAAIDPVTSARWTWQPCGTLMPSTVSATEVFYSPVREEVAARYEDGSIVLHTVDAQVPDRTLFPAGGRTTAIAFSPDGTLLAEAHDTVSLRRIEDGQVVAPAFATDARCDTNRLGFSPDGARVLGWNPTALCVWSTRTGELEAVIERSYFSAALTTDGIIGVGAVSPASIERVSLPALTRTVIAPDLPVDGILQPDAVAISPTGDGFAATIQTSSGRLIRLWGADGHTLRSVTAAAEQRIAYSTNGLHVLLDGATFSARTGAAETAASVQIAEQVLALNMTGTRAVALGSLRTVTIAIVYALPSGAEIRVCGTVPPPPPHNSGIWALSIAPDGKMLVASLIGNVMVFKLAPDFARSIAVRSRSWSGTPFALSFSAAGDHLLASGDGWALASALDGRIIEEVLPTPVVGDCLWSIATLSPRDTWLAVGDYGPSVSVRHLSNRSDGFRPVPTANCNARAAFSRDETLMATSGPELYQTSDWRRLWPGPVIGSASPQLNSPFTDVRFAPGEHELLVSSCGTPISSDGDIYACRYALYDVASGARLRDLAILSARHAEFSSEGHWILSGSVLQHLGSGALRSLTMDDQAPSVSIFAPNGDVIAAMPDNRLVRYCRNDGVPAASL